MIYLMGMWIRKTIRRTKIDLDEGEACKYGAKLLSGMRSLGAVAEVIWPKKAQ